MARRPSMRSLTTTGRSPRSVISWWQPVRASIKSEQFQFDAPAVAFSEHPKIVQIGQYSAELDAEAARLPFLFASAFENVNTLCEECESPAADDACVLLPCSFCNLSFKNSTECLGKRTARSPQRHSSKTKPTSGRAHDTGRAPSRKHATP